MSQTTIPWRPASASTPAERPSFWERAAARLSPREGWPTVLLVIAAPLVVVWSVQRAHWVREVPSLGVIVLVASAVALLAAKARAPGLLLHLLAALFGLLFVSWMMLAAVPGLSWEEHIVELVSRVLAWFFAAAHGGISNDSVPFGFFLAVLAWAISYWTLWFILRGRHVWLALGPSLVAVLVNLSHFPGSSGALFALYVGLALLIVVRTNAQLQEDAWARSRTEHGGGLPFSLFQEALLAVIALVLLAWLLPLPRAVPFVHSAWRDLTHPWTGAETQFGRLFSSLRSGKNMPLHTFDTALPFRGQVNLGQNVVMTVAADAPDYWRARSYDLYTSKGWLSSDLVTRPLEIAPDESQVEQYRLQRPFNFTFEPLEPSNVVFTAGHPLEVSLPVRAERARELTYTLDLQDASKDRGLPPDLQALTSALAQRQAAGRITKDAIQASLPSDARLLSWTADGPRFSQLAVGRVEPQFGNVLAVLPTQRYKGGYSLTASLSVADASDLRRASAIEPGWVKDRYTRLPDQLPARVRDLAQQLTKGQPTPYDKALAVQDYLRTLRYTFEVPVPPSDRDFVDWFLFDLKAGYCDYYSSAFAVLLRSLGIPARVSAGYFTGQWEPSLKKYVVSEADGHSWPEVYFPDYGWVRFEPTPARPAVVRGDAAALLGPGAVGEGVTGTGDPFLDEFLLQELLAAQGGGGLGAARTSSGGPAPVVWALPLGLLALAALALAFFWRRGLRGLAPEARAYVQVARLASWAGLGPQPGHTPQEFGRDLAQSVPQARNDVDLVVGEYTRATYGRRPVQAISDNRASLRAAWSRLRRHLLWRATLGRLGRKAP